MPLVPLKTFSAPGVPLYAAAGSGGGGGSVGPNPVVSTLTLAAGLNDGTYTSGVINYQDRLTFNNGNTPGNEYQNMILDAPAPSTVALTLFTQDGEVAIAFGAGETSGYIVVENQSSFLPVPLDLTQPSGVFISSLTVSSINGAAPGGGGGQNLTVSTIVLEGSTDPLEITLPANLNDGFSVRQGGINNAIAILTIEEESSGQTEFGIRSLSTIAGAPEAVARFEMTYRPDSPTAQLTYTRDDEVSGAASTIGSVTFAPGNGFDRAGQVRIDSENGGGGFARLTVGNYQVIGNSGACLNPRAFAPQVNVYVPAGGATQQVAAFSTLTGNMYELHIPNLRVQNEPAGVPQAGAWAQLVLTTGTGAIETFDMASVSTVQNDLLTSRSYSFQATADGTGLLAIGNTGNTLSTAFTFNPCLIRDLGNFGNILLADAAP